MHSSADVSDIMSAQEAGREDNKEESDGEKDEV